MDGIPNRVVTSITTNFDDKVGSEVVSRTKDEPGVEAMVSITGSFKVEEAPCEVTVTGVDNGTSAIDRASGGVDIRVILSITVGVSCNTDHDTTTIGC